jgi:ribosomal protein S27E
MNNPDSGTVTWTNAPTQVGWCSLCGGSVVTPQMWAGTEPPRICQQCGAVAIQPQSSTLPVIPMRPKS